MTLTTTWGSRGGAEGEQRDVLHIIKFATILLFNINNVMNVPTSTYT